MLKLCMVPFQINCNNNNNNAVVLVVFRLFLFLNIVFILQYFSIYLFDIVI